MSTPPTPESGPQQNPPPQPQQPPQYPVPPQGDPGQPPTPRGNPPQPGYPGQPQAYPPQPQAYPGQPQGYPAPGQVPGEVPPGVPAKKKPSRARTIVTLVVGLGVLAVIVFFALTSFNVNTTKVGDCLAKDGTDSVKTVACNSPDATYKVISIVEDQVEPTDENNPCLAVEGAESSYWEGKEGGTGRTLCLAKL